MTNIISKNKLITTRPYTFEKNKYGKNAFLRLNE